MQIVIDIPKGEYDKICKTMLHTSSGNPNFYFESKIANGTPIPDNATNRDVAELVWGFKPRENTCIIPKTKCNGNPAECDGCRFDDWWNAPYQKGGKE